MQSAIFLFRLDFMLCLGLISARLLLSTIIFQRIFFVIFCGNVFSRQQNFLFLIRVFVLSLVRYNQGS